MRAIRWLIKQREGDPDKRFVANFGLSLIAFSFLVGFYLWHWKFIVFLTSIVVVVALMDRFLEPRINRGLLRTVKLLVRSILLWTYLPLCRLNRADWDMYSYMYLIPQAEKAFHCTKEVPRPDKEHLRVVLLSDIHATHRFIGVPHGDLLIITGDLLFSDECAFGQSGLNTLQDINTWLGSLPHKYKIITAGNHDHTLQRVGPLRAKQVFSNALYLENELTVIEGLKIFGSPMSVANHEGGHNTAFQLAAQDAISQLESLAVGHVDLFLVHGLPEEVLDQVAQRYRPKFVVSGHVHQDYGFSFSKESTFINAATVDSLYLPTHPPIVFDIIL